VSDLTRVNRRKYARAQEYIRTGAWIVDPDAGEVYSRRTGRPLRPQMSVDGYRNYGITLPNSPSAKWKVIPVRASRVIYEAVYGLIPYGLEINHIDGNKSNDRIVNLEAITPAKNIQHAVRTRLLVAPKGEDNGRSRLTEQQVREIRALVGQGHSQGVVVDAFGVTQSTVSVVVRRLTWSHIS
jgi:hypothetical protein